MSPTTPSQRATATAAHELAAALGLEPTDAAYLAGLAAGQAEHGLRQDDATTTLRALLDPDLATEELEPPAALQARFGLCRVRGEGGGWAIEIVARDGSPLDAMGSSGSFLLHPDDPATALVRPARGEAVVIAGGDVGLGLLQQDDGQLALLPLQRTTQPVAGAAAAALFEDALAYRASEGEDADAPLAHAHPMDVAAARALLEAETRRLDHALATLLDGLDDDDVDVEEARLGFDALAARRLAAAALRTAIAARQSTAALDDRLARIDARGAAARAALGSPRGDHRLQDEAIGAPLAWWADTRWADDGQLG